MDRFHSRDSFMFLQKRFLFIDWSRVLKVNILIWICQLANFQALTKATFNACHQTYLLSCSKVWSDEYLSVSTVERNSDYLTLSQVYLFHLAGSSEFLIALIESVALFHSSVSIVKRISALLAKKSLSKANIK